MSASGKMDGALRRLASVRYCKPFINTFQHTIQARQALKDIQNLHYSRNPGKLIS